MSAQSSSQLNLTQLKLQAKELLRAHASGDPGAAARIGQSHPKFVEEPPEQLAACSFTLTHAQLVIARENGFSTWPQMKRHIELLAGEASSFDQAVQAMIHGKAGTLRALLVNEPELVRARSTSSHRCTLLHYIRCKWRRTGIADVPTDREHSSASRGGSRCDGTHLRRWPETGRR